MHTYTAYPFSANWRLCPSHMCRLHDDRAVFELNTEIQLLLKQGQVRQICMPERARLRELAHHSSLSSCDSVLFLSV